MEVLENYMDFLLIKFVVANTRHHEPGSVAQQQEYANLDQIQKNFNGAVNAAVSFKSGNPNKICKVGDMAGSSAERLDCSSEKGLELELATNHLTVAGDTPLQKEHAVQLWPECWKMVFDEIKDAESMEACYNTCSGWRKDLARKRTSFLFHKVLPFLEHHLSTTSILECRSVSKMWKQGVEDYLDDILRFDLEYGLVGLIYQDEERHILDLDGSNDFALWLASDNIDKMKSLIKLVENAGSGVPVCVPKKVLLGDMWSMAEDEVWFWLFVVNQLLPKVGYLFQMCYFMFHGDLSKRLIHVIIMSALSYMPNLVGLNIDYDPGEDDTGDGIIEQFGVLENFKPRLDNVNSLSILGPAPCETLSLLFNSPLRNLESDYCSEYDHILYLGSPGLKVLSLKYVVVRLLSNLRYARRPNISSQEVSKLPLRITSIFNASLEKAIFGLKVEDITFLINYRFEFPVLHTLEIYVDGWLYCDFLLTLKNLKHLTIHNYFVPSDYVKKNALLKIGDFEDHFYDSNVWTVLPKLCTVKIKSKDFTGTYDRKGWLKSL